ncbi:MAG: hypothetical protein U0232_24625 [Thermomicrobiales bacterium]
MDEQGMLADDGYDAWVTAALGELEQRAVVTLRPLLAPRAADLDPQERAAATLARVIAALAAEARIEASYADAASEPVRRGSFADYHRQFPEAED